MNDGEGDEEEEDEDEEGTIVLEEEIDENYEPT